MKTRWRIIFGAIIFVILFYLISKIDFPEVYQILKSIKPEFFLLAFGSFSLGILIFNLRSMISLREIIKEHDFWFFFKTTLAGSFANVITPGSNVGGEPIRAYFLGKKYNKPKTKVFGAVLADRIIHGAVSLFFIIASLLFILTYIPVSGELKIIFQTILFFLLAFLALVFLLNMKKISFNFEKFLKKIGIFKKLKNSKKIRHIGEHFGN
ncbi:MAG: lysylphosphatidylglycerol synthase transmembrane domain-containing protein, partial [Candidatus Pacearchaeota archaeon]|nr:lysylphosphatidylglycerol synthase transmembrane domain-containing protein [Candidatus Pacearchaeota archaeon]